MEDENVTPSRRRGLVAALLAVGAIAVALPASGALAGGGDAAGTPSPGAATSDPGFVQNAQEESQAQPDGRDCPKDKDGSGGEDQGGTSQGTDESPQL